MRIDAPRRLRAAACIGGLLLLGGAMTDTLAAKPRLTDLVLEDGLLIASVSHLGSGVVSGRLVVEFEVDGKRSHIEVPYRGVAGQKIFVQAMVPSSVDRIIQVGIIVDDGAPI
ncbi:MAG: hypothetical protein OEV00_04860 [Acidobacteriota bacterium]|nr:hypothetical protein [Acidobacteriota bacterium]MDH3784645.1 hypothetical protein [Acidobacteriota bacterium]